MVVEYYQVDSVYKQLVKVSMDFLNIVELEEEEFLGE